METTNAIQRRVRDELLAWGRPRPAVSEAMVHRLRAGLEAGLAAAADLVPPGERTVIGKSALNALVCDGRFLDQRASAFAWSPRLLRGILSHKAIEVDWRTARSTTPAEVVGHAWSQLATATGGLADALNALDDIAARVLEAEAAQDVLEMREAWPVLPDHVEIRFEPMLRVPLAGGRIVLQGAPDLVLGSTSGDDARMLVLDLKTGQPRPEVERQEARFYALLATLRYGRPPFRWGTYHVPEAGWLVEDLDEEPLRASVRRVVDGASRAVRLIHRPPPEHDLELSGGAWCAWCGREPFCDEAAARPVRVHSG